METVTLQVHLAQAHHHACTILDTDPLTFESDSQQWAYAISLPVRCHASGAEAIRLLVDVTVKSGELGMLMVGSDWSTPLGPVPPGVRAGRHTVRLVLHRHDPAAQLVFRNNTSGNQRCSFIVNEISASTAPPGEPLVPSRLAEVTPADGGRIVLSRLRTASGADAGASPAGHIDIVSVDALHRRLGFDTPISYPAASRAKSLADWRMEDDDAPILRYLYRHVAPRRHLEFGTWEGTGACYCLEESNATVWTINLSHGEVSGGDPAYASPVASPPAGAVPIEESGGTKVYQTDAGIFIGHKYRDAGFGHRVCQILCDSRQWDTTNYAPGFFDSVLIDGGHSKDVVVSDTRAALALTRPGGLVMWHDFCPDPAVIGIFPTVSGVVSALAESWSEIRPLLGDVFWVFPSYLLIGVRGPVTP